MTNKKLNGKQIIEALEESYNGLDTVRYERRWENGDNRAKKIHWLMDNFGCSWGIANRIVGKANGYIA